MENRNDNIMGSMSEGKLLAKLAMPMIFSVLVSSLYNKIWHHLKRTNGFRGIDNV